MNPQPLQLLERRDTAYFVGRMRRTSELAFWRRWIIRSAVWITGYSDGFESQAICTSEAVAEDLCLHDGYFYERLPIDVSLPDGAARFSPTIYPKAKITRRIYDTKSSTMVAIKQSDLDKLIQKAERLASA